VYQERRPKEVPIYIGATGMQMMELTGEIADGCVLNYLCRRHTTPGAAAPATGAERVGRSLDDIDRPQLVVCSLDEDRDRASTTPGPRDAVPRAAAAHHEGVGRAGVVEDIGRVLTWPATHEQVWRRQAGPTRWCR
jgi:5,10-methylenetetrahydromethanopterin reductase